MRSHQIHQRSVICFDPPWALVTFWIPEKGVSAVLNLEIRPEVPAPHAQLCKITLRPRDALFFETGWQLENLTGMESASGLEMIESGYFTSVIGLAVEFQRNEAEHVVWLHLIALCTCLDPLPKQDTDQRPRNPKSGCDTSLNKMKHSSLFRHDRTEP